MTAPDVVLAQYDTFTCVEPSTELVVETGDHSAQRIDGTNQPFANTNPSFTPPHVYPRTQLGDTSYMAYAYKVLMGYDTIHDPEIFTFDYSLKLSTGMSDIVGFTRFAYTPGVNVPNINLILRLGFPDAEPLSPLPRTEFIQDINGK